MKAIERVGVAQGINKARDKRWALCKQPRDHDWQSDAEIADAYAERLMSVQISTSWTADAT